MFARLKSKQLFGLNHETLPTFRTKFSSARLSVGISEVRNRAFACKLDFFNWRISGDISVWPQNNAQLKYLARSGLYFQISSDLLPLASPQGAEMSFAFMVIAPAAVAFVVVTMMLLLLMLRSCRIASCCCKCKLRLTLVALLGMLAFFACLIENCVSLHLMNGKVTDDHTECTGKNIYIRNIHLYRFHSTLNIIYWLW